MQITLPFFAFVSLNVMSYQTSGYENIDIPSGYATDINESGQIHVMNEKDQPENDGEKQ